MTAAGSTSPLRVLVAGTSWPMETFLDRLLTGLAAEGLELTIRSRHRPSTTWLRRTGIAWEHGLGSTHRAALEGQLRENGPVDATRAALAALRHHLDATRNGRPDDVDVVYVPWVNALMTHPELFDMGVPVVTSCRGSLVTIAPWDPDRPHYRDDLVRVFSRSAVVHCVSDDILEEAVALGLDPSKARVIHPAVSPAAFQPADRARRRTSSTRVIGVGSLIWRKDYEHALIAMRRAVDAGADLLLELIGEGPDAQHLRYTIGDLELGDRVTLRGRLDPGQVAAALSDADVFLHTSSTEGVSNAVLEAMATGLPVVTTDAGGMREAVRDGVDGFVVPVRGTAEMAAGLIALASDTDLRLRLGASARHRVTAEFRLDQQIQRFSDLLVQAAAGVAPR